MTNPQPTDTALDEFYARHYRRYYQKTAVPTLAYIREYRKDERAAYTADFLIGAEAARGSARVLDVGAAEGSILKALLDRAPGLRCVAVEPDPEFRAFASRYVGCPVVRDLRELAPRKERFDLIVLNHVLEHLKHPSAYLASLSEYLTNDGQIYVDVPDLLEYEGLESLHIAHLYHFTPRTLAATAEAAGFAVHAIEAHAPIMHPRSIRTLLARRPEPAPLQLESVHEGWDRIKRISHRAWRYHRRRWGLNRRLCARIRASFGRV